MRLFLGALLLITTVAFPLFAEEAKNPTSATSEEAAYSPQNLPDEKAMQAEMDFYVGNDREAESIFQGLKAKKDRNIALWSNQLGVLYLAEGKTKEAKETFMDAYLLMNNVTAFKDLEAHSIGLTGDEANKAYKGDPYEKVFNSFYLGMLFYAENDLENALACFKNGILCDSDVEGNLYKSDVTLLYLMASRTEALLKDQSMSDDFLHQATSAFYLSYPDNRSLVSQEQGLLDSLHTKQKALAAKEAPYAQAPQEAAATQASDKKQNFSGSAKAAKMSAQEEKETSGLKADIAKLEGDIKSLSDTLEQNNEKIPIAPLKEFVNPENNTLLFVETGRGPLKFQVGKYGEKVVFTQKPQRITAFSVSIDNATTTDAANFLQHNDVFYQASTRGGRMMDGILKGKAEFKQTTSDVSNLFSDMSSAYDPYGIFSFISMASGAVSEVTNPYSDARHWSLLPAQIQVIPLRLSPGTHRVQLDAYDCAGRIVETATMDIAINDSPHNVIFKRFREKID